MPRQIQETLNVFDHEAEGRDQVQMANRARHNPSILRRRLGGVKSANGVHLRRRHNVSAIHIKTLSKTQPRLALSSGESESYAALQAPADGFGVMPLLKDFHYEVKGGVPGDASAALGIIHRRGL